MIHDPERRGRELAAFYLAVAPRLFHDVVESGMLPPAGPSHAQAQTEWECFGLYACVRGLVAAGGFNVETGRAIEALHEAVIDAWNREAEADEPIESRRARVSERYHEYGEIGQAGGASGAATVAQRLGEAAARHMTAPAPPPDDLADMIGALHEALAEGAAEATRRQE